MQWKINKINIVSRSASGKIKVKQWKRNTTHNYTTYNTELNNIQRNTWTVSTHFLYHLFKGRQLYQREITPLAKQHNAPNWTLNINVILFLLLAISCNFFQNCSWNFMNQSCFCVLSYWFWLYAAHISTIAKKPRFKMNIKTGTLSVFSQFPSPSCFKYKIIYDTT